MNYENKIILDADQQRALLIMLSGRNAFLSGPAGTGKSVLINAFVKQTNKTVVLIAPTGTAALNIGGSTIHRFFTFPTGTLTEKRVSELCEFLDAEKLATLLAANVFVVDEISMVRADLFSAMDFMLRKITGKKTAFGGKQIIVCGDFLQLPPVITPDEANAFHHFFKSPFAFKTKSWERADFANIELKTVYRQHDPEHIIRLNTIRTGEHFPGGPSLEQCIEDINADCSSRIDIFRSEATIMCCTRRMASAINSSHLESLSDYGIFCDANIIGTFPEEMWPTYRSLHIKRGERVILLENKVDKFGTFEHVNGSAGIIMDYSEGLKPQLSVQLDNGRMVCVKQKMWTYSSYELIDGELKTKEIGWFHQLPVIPAYAITVHRLQGQTWDTGVLYLKNGCFCSGQLYTGLSRIRNLENLLVTPHITRGDVIIDPEALEFYRNLRCL